MPDFDNNGATVHYELIGAGPPLLCIAGTASDGTSWGPLTPLLADRYRLILIDNRGCGRTRADGPLSLTDMADDAAALLERLGIAQANVVGHSLGGYLALLLAARHPARVKRVVTLAAGTITHAKRTLFHDMARLYFTTPPEDWFRLLYQWLFSDPFFADEATVAAAAAGSAAYPHRQSPADFARQVAAIDALGPVDLSLVKAPVLAVTAGLDLLAPEPTVRALHAKVPEVTHKLIETAAHSIHWEAPEAVAQLIRDHLR
jgi:pimeloyl-ACP methyl ester carboxylesterase